jgi:hypothetical protein
MIATNMLNRGMSARDVEEILEPLTQDMKGF